MFTASQDGTVKIWSGKCEKQLGQFNSSIGISVVCRFSADGYNDNENNVFIFGDQMGNLNIVRWPKRID